MRREITNNKLWLIESELEQLGEKHPGIAFLFDVKLGQFFSRNKTNLIILHKRMHEIQKKYIVHDEKNKPQYADTKEGENMEWLYLESVIGENNELLTGDKIAKAYHDEADMFLGRSVNVEL